MCIANDKTFHICDLDLDVCPYFEKLEFLLLFIYCCRSASVVVFCQLLFIILSHLYWVQYLRMKWCDKATKLKLHLRVPDSSMKLHAPGVGKVLSKCRALRFLPCWNLLSRWHLSFTNTSCLFDVDFCFLLEQLKSIKWFQRSEVKNVSEMPSIVQHRILNIGWRHWL